MTALTALSITTYGRAWLRTARRARLLHVFERACTLIADDGRVLSLVTPDIGNGPFNVIVPLIAFAPHLTITDSVHVTSHGLRVGSLTIDCTTADEWEPCPDWDRLRAQRNHFRAQLPLLRAALQMHAPANSLAQLVIDLPSPEDLSQGAASSASLSAIEICSPLEQRVMQLAHHQWQALHQGLMQGDHAACVASVAQLVGLGGGLTPAGDDWLVGAVLASHLDPPTSPPGMLLRAVVEQVAARTNPLSAHWLHAAVAGACGARWHTFFEGSLSPSTESIHHAILNVIHQGHSSGADALAGFIAWQTIPESEKVHPNNYLQK